MHRVREQGQYKEDLMARFGGQMPKFQVEFFDPLFGDAAIGFVMAEGEVRSMCARNTRWPEVFVYELTESGKSWRERKDLASDFVPGCEATMMYPLDDMPGHRG